MWQDLYRYSYEKSFEIIKINFSVDRWAFGHWISIEFTSTSGAIQKWVYCKIPIDFSTSPLCVHFTVATFYMSLNLNWHTQSGSFLSIFIFFPWMLSVTFFEYSVFLTPTHFQELLVRVAKVHTKRRKGKKGYAKWFCFQCKHWK